MNTDTGWGVFMVEGTGEGSKIYLVKENKGVWMGSMQEAREKAAAFNAKAKQAQQNRRYVAMSFAEAGM
jgi:hypothetical protein